MFAAIRAIFYYFVSVSALVMLLCFTCVKDIQWITFSLLLHYVMDRFYLEADKEFREKTKTVKEG